MDSIQDFLQSAGESLGVSQDATRSATGGLLQYIQKQVGEGDFSKLLGSIPGSKNFVEGASGAASTGGMLGGLTGKIGDAVGGNLGKLGSAASVMGLFDKAGLDMGQAGKLVTMFFSFAEDKAGSEFVDQILGKVPDLKKLIG